MRTSDKRRKDIMTFSRTRLLILALVAVLTPVACSRTVAYIPVPETFPPHPRLFLNQRGIDELKAWADREPWLRAYVDKFVADMLEAAENPELPDANKGRNVGLARKANEFALAYVLSDEPKLAEAAADILRAYVQVFPDYPVGGFKGKATDSTLAEASWAMGVAAAYDLIYHSGALSEDDKRAIETKVFRPCGEVLRICNHAHRSNWRSRALCGLGVVGFCIGDREFLDEALNGLRDETGWPIRDGFVHHLGWSVLADGVYYERALGYHQFVLSHYTWLLEAARHNGVDLWHLEAPGHEYDAGADIERRFGPTGPKNIKALFEAPFYYTFGDGSVARVGNSTADRLQQQRFYEPAWRATRDPKFAWAARLGGGERRPGTRTDLMWMAPDLPEGRFDLADDARIGLNGRHVNACSFFPNGGLTVLRQSPDKDAVGVLMTYGEWGSAHCHPDQLAIVLYAAGRQVLPEVRYHGYGHEHFVSWDRQTLAHNTVTVDETAQYPQGDADDAWVGDTRERPARGRPVFFHPGERLKAFRADCDVAYEGVLLDRTVALVDSVLVDFFRCRSKDEHQYDYALQIDAELSDCSPALGEVEPGPLSDRFGYRHIVEVRRADVQDRAAALTFVSGDDGPTLRLKFFPTADAELVVGKGHADEEGHRKGVLLLRSRGGDVDFVSVMGFAEGLRARRLTDLPPGVLGVEIARPDGSKDVVLSAEAAQTLEYAGQSVSGRLVLLRISADGSAAVIETVE